jgi:Helix-turn-helix domain
MELRRLERTRLEPAQAAEQPVTASVFLTTAEAAAFLRISPVTLGRWRIEGCGPAYRKFGRRVVYAHADLAAWTEAQRRASTSEPKRRDQP